MRTCAGDTNRARMYLIPNRMRRYRHRELVCHNRTKGADHDTLWWSQATLIPRQQCGNRDDAVTALLLSVSSSKLSHTC